MTKPTNVTPPARLLLLEIGDLETQDQFDTLIDAGVNNLFMNVTEILRRPTRAEVDALIERHGSGPSGRQLDLLKLFSLFPVELTENAVVNGSNISPI